MIAYKTSGDWEDVTSAGRNNIVFEGRNKEYGAYFVRQRYNGALLLALFIAASVGVLLAAVPFVFNLLNKNKATVNSGTIHLVAHLKNPVKPFIPPKVITRTVTPLRHAITHVKTQRYTQPVIVKHQPIQQIVTTSSVTKAVIGTSTVKGNAIILGTGGNIGAGTAIAKPALQKPFLIVQRMPTFKGDFKR